MPLLAFLVTTAFWPYFGPASNVPRWALLSVGLPVLLLTRPIAGPGRRHPLPAIYILLAFLAWSALTLLWTRSVPDGLDALWHMALFVMAFAIGTTLSEHQFRLVMLGAGLGMIVSAAIAIPQWYGWTGILQASDPPAGLFMNRNYMAETALIVMAPLIAMRLWWLVLPILPALLLPNSRGVFLAAAGVVFVAVWRRSRSLALGMALAAGIAVGGYAALVGTDLHTIGNRTTYWANSIGMLVDKPWGQGIGGFWSAYPFYHDAVTTTPEGGEGYNEDYRPRSAHNDFLTALAETGPGALLLFSVLGWAAWRGSGPARYGLLAFLGCGIAGFPLLIPASAFLGALCAGHLYRPGGGLRGHLRHRRASFLCGAKGIARQRPDRRTVLTPGGC